MRGEDFDLTDKDVKDMQRHLNTLLNTLDFFLLYAEADQWEADPGKAEETPKVEQVLDKWILARLFETQKAIEKAMNSYDTPASVKPILELIEDLSNWYVRRSRRRFWKSENDSDKTQAYETLYFVLVQTSKLIAPFVPFVAEHMYKTLTGLESVHLTDWPEKKKLDDASRMLLDSMHQIRELITQGLAQRAAAGIKVRQPLATVEVPKIPEEFKSIIAEELNVKDVLFYGGREDHTINLDINVSPELKEEGIARELIRAVQNARKNAGFNVEDRIQTSLSSESSEIANAAEKFKDMINAETLTVGALTKEPEHSETVKVEGQELTIKLSRA
jgi:isoleucyl-tRNA synthetase